MADKVYDVVFVGCGSKSSAAAMYLTKYAKLSVGIFEERHEICAGWCSEEQIAPGWVADPCSNMHTHWPMYWGPVFEDFPELADHGVQYITLPVSSTFVRPDHRSFNIYSEEFDPNHTKTAASIAQFSKKDAETWLRVWEKWKTKWQQAFYATLFNPAGPPDQDPILALLTDPQGGLDGPLDPLWLFNYDPVQLGRELFETPEIWQLLYRVMDTSGFVGSESGMGFMALLAILFWTHYGIVQGGTHHLAHAVQRVITENGGEIFQRCPVEKILIENGSAKGIRLMDSTEIEAKVAVVSSVDIHQLMFDLVGEEHFEPIDVTRVKNLSADYNALFWYYYGWKEHPEFKAAEYNPDIKWSGYISLGQHFPSLETVKIYDALRRLGGEMPKDRLEVVISNRTQCDPTRAPSPEYSTAIVDVFTKQGIWSRREFMKFFRKLEKDIHDVITNFAPNLTRDKMVGHGVEGPTALWSMSRSFYRGNWGGLDLNSWQVGRARPTPNLSSGRMPVKNLYAVGMCFYPMSFASIWGGYNCYKLMSEDLGLPKPWEDKGRVPERVETAYKHCDAFRAKYQFSYP